MNADIKREFTYISEPEELIRHGGGNAFLFLLFHKEYKELVKTLFVCRYVFLHEMFHYLPAFLLGLVNYWSMTVEYIQRTPTSTVYGRNVEGVVSYRRYSSFLPKWYMYMAQYIIASGPRWGTVLVALVAITLAPYNVILAMVVAILFFDTRTMPLSYSDRRSISESIIYFKYGKDVRQIRLLYAS